MEHPLLGGFNDPVLADDDQLWQLLRSLDDPCHLELPVGYHHVRERARFDQLAQRLDHGFGCRSLVDRHAEDASFHGRIDIPAPATESGHRLVVVISNFGSLAVVAVDNPGVWTDAEAALLLHPGDGRLIDSALAEFGYVRVPEEPLWRRYDGVGMRLDGRPWWDRFFCYL